VRENVRVDETHETRPARVRRAPRIGVFIGLGAILGIVVTIAVTTSFPADPNVGMWATVAYMSLYGVTGGIVLGAIAALIADRVSRRRMQPVTVERGRVSERSEPAGETPVPEASEAPTAGATSSADEPVPGDPAENPGGGAADRT